MTADPKPKKATFKYGAPIWRQSLIAVVEELVKKDPGWGEVINECHSKLLTGFYDQEYVGTLGQKGRGMYDFYDAFAFANMHAAVTQGEIFLAKIKVVEPPYGDKEVEANNRVLSKLPKPFKAEFWGGYDGPDGRLVWKDDIVVSASIMRLNGLEKEVRKTIPPSEAALEVGYTEFGKSYYQLKKFGRLARWPYNSAKITLYFAEKWGLQYLSWEASNTDTSSNLPQENGETAISSREAFEYVVRRWADLSEQARHRIMGIINER